MTSSQPTQPLTDAELARIDKICEGGWTPAGLDQGRLWVTLTRHREANQVLEQATIAAVKAKDALAAEVDRLRAELDSMTRFAEDLREERDRRLRAEGERGVERDALAAKIEATAELHPAWFCETCNSPGPCLTRLRLGLDQDGNGQAND